MRRQHVPRSLMRRILGWSLIGLALWGFVLPVVPGVIFLALGILALGPHDPTLRRIGVAIRLLLRRWSQMRQPYLRRVGQFARIRYCKSRLILRAHLHDHERGVNDWRSHWVLLVVTLMSMAGTAAGVFLIWHRLL